MTWKCNDTAAARIAMTKVWLYRVSAYLLVNFVDDPVWLALLFC